MRSVALALALALSALGLVAAPAPAQAQVSAGGVDDAGLVSMLNGLGYDPRALSKGQLIQLKRGTWTLYVQLVLSSDGAKLGMNANLGDVTPDAVTATQWLDVLAANADIDPSTFYFDAKLNRLLIHRAIDNRSMTPSFLRGQLDIFLDQIISTANTWQPIVH